MFQTGRKRIHLEPRGRHRRLPVGPAPGGRHLERRDCALRLRHGYQGRAAPGRLRRGVLKPTPPDCGSADQRDYSCKDAGQAHVIPLLIARSCLSRLRLPGCIRVIGEAAPIRLNARLSTAAYALVHNFLIRSGQFSILWPELFLIGDCGVAANIRACGQLLRKTLTKRSVRGGQGALQFLAMLYCIDSGQCFLEFGDAL